MTKAKQILFLLGDGIGPEVSAEAKKVLEHISQQYNFDLEIHNRLIEDCYSRKEHQYPTPQLIWQNKQMQYSWEASEVQSGTA